METNKEKEIVYGSQQYIDYLSLMYHREVAERLRREPERILNIARDNLRRWLASYERGSSEARCFEEWEHLLDTLSVSELIAIITEDSDKGQRLRSSTPFPGVLTNDERKEIAERMKSNIFTGNPPRLTREDLHERR